MNKNTKRGEIQGMNQLNKRVMKKNKAFIKPLCKSLDQNEFCVLRMCIKRLLK